MVQFNLLPDVKIQYIKTRHRKRTVIFLAAGISIVCLAIFILLLLYVRVNQPRYMKDLDNDISTNVKTIKNIPDVDKILTVQNQLKSLPELHDKKVVSSRLIDYMSVVTPDKASISNLETDFEANTITVKGNADSLATVNKYADNLKFAKFTVNNEGAQTGSAFKEVVLKSFTVPSTSENGGAFTYEISFGFDPIIFGQVKDAKDANKPVELKVPSIISNNSVVNSNVFGTTDQPTTTGGQ